MIHLNCFLEKIMKRIYIILLLLILTACSTRKTQHTDTTLESTVAITQVDTSSQKTTSIDKLIDTTKVEEITYEPIDSTKEMTIDGKIYKNVRFKTSKSNKGITILNTKDNVLNEKKTIKENISTKIDTTTKETERTSPSMILYIIIGIVFVVGVIWELNKKL